MIEYFHIVQALCRAALQTPSAAVLQQIERLSEQLEKNGLLKESKALRTLLNATEHATDMAPSRIRRSEIIEGEELTSKTPIPVDKETSTQLAEIFFSRDLPDEPPIFESNVEEAIGSILNEWAHYRQLSEIQAQPSKSCLIYGAPGTGKTYLALWIAKQINMPVVLARLDGLMSSFLGTTSRNIGNLFAFAARFRCILLLDEFDAIAKLRNDPQEVGEIKRVVNTLLQNLDARRGFTIGITNHESLLDPAIWRRFEVQIEIPKPSPEVLYSMIKKFQAPLSFDDTQLKFLSWSIDNASGADAEAMMKWIKKSTILDKESGSTIIDHIRRFAILNSGRIDAKKRRILGNSDQEIASALLSDDRFSFKKKDVASLLNISPSHLTKKLAKTKEIET